MANRRVPRWPLGCHALLARAAAHGIGLLAMTWAAAAARAAEAAVLVREESELPRLEVASPADRPPYCITLETIMAFAGRVKAHAARCPKPDHAPAVAEWDKTRAEHSKLFSQHRCKRTR
ncbi:MAG: hypothetical protein QOD25_1849 [Alphaproteobacteria bacterium]|nr:hypothetical protein [Alphaproteobacteria bacterium]